MPYFTETPTVKLEVYAENDKRLMDELLSFLISENINAINYSGGIMYRDDIYLPEDADKIKTWLRAREVDQEPSMVDAERDNTLMLKIVRFSYQQVDPEYDTMFYFAEMLKTHGIHPLSRPREQGSAYEAVFSARSANFVEAWLRREPYVVLES